MSYSNQKVLPLIPPKSHCESEGTWSRVLIPPSYLLHLGRHPTPVYSTSKITLKWRFLLPEPAATAMVGFPAFSPLDNCSAPGFFTEEPSLCNPPSVVASFLKHTPPGLSLVCVPLVAPQSQGGNLSHTPAALKALLFLT